MEENQRLYDGSPLAEAEIEMVEMLNKEQCDAIARWLKLYGYAFAKQSACGDTVITNFEYAANRLEILGKNGLPERPEVKPSKPPLKFPVEENGLDESW